MNYNEQMEEIVKKFDTKKRLLLHSCCAPCSSSVIERLIPFFNITVLYYNPNIAPQEEYELRKKEQINFIEKLNDKYSIDYLEIDYENDLYEKEIENLKKEKEGGKRCFVCYEMRLKKTAMLAKKLGYDFFTTTLTVSPYKNASKINEIGFKLENTYKVSFLPCDFKKKNGYLRSIELAKKYKLYRQNYCGCIYSKRD